MAAYLIGQIEVREPALWRTYVAGVAESLRGFDAEVLFRGRLARVLAGQQPRSQCVVIRFADAATDRVLGEESLEPAGGDEAHRAFGVEAE